MAIAEPLRDNARAPFAPLDYGLYTTIVLLWGTSWIAIHWQLGVVSPHISVFWRFLLAALLLLGWGLFSGARMRFPAAEHVRFAALGACLFSTNFLLFYNAGLSIPSGLIAVVFSLASVLNIGLGALIYGTRPSPRVATGAVAGFLGVAAMFEPEIVGTEFDLAALTGLGLAIAGTCCFALGNMVSAGIQRRGIAVVPANSWGMAYGLVILLAFALWRGEPFIIETTPRYLLSLLYLALFASVLGFGAYLTLLGRIGAARAGFSTVMYPVVALMISTVFEDYVWTWQALLGLGLVLAGNLLVLTTGQRAPST